MYSTEKEKKAQYKHSIIGVIVLILFFGIAAYFESEKESTETSEPIATEVTEGTPEKEISNSTNEVMEVEETVKENFPSDFEINAPEFKDAVKSVNINIDNVEVNDNKVTITFKEDLLVWDDTSFVKDAATRGISIMEKVFANKQVNEVTIIVPTKMYDNKGNESIENVIEITWNRQLSDEINYANFNDLVWSDPIRFYNVANSYYIHPGVFQNIKDEYLTRFENGFNKLAK